MKKLTYDDIYKGNDHTKVLTNQFEMAEKINEIIDHIGAIENDLEMIHWNSPKKLEVKHDEEEFPDIFCYTDKENEVIKKCLKYCWHRYYQHTHVGIHSALSAENVSRFQDLIKKI